MENINYLGIVFLFLITITHTVLSQNSWIAEHLEAEQMELSQTITKYNENVDDSSCNNSIALSYHKKFIATLFNRDKMHYNEMNGVYEHALVFSILPDQLQQLESLNDPRDIDIILTEILLKATKPLNSYRTVDTTANNILPLFTEIFKDFIQLLKISEVHFTLLTIFVLLVGWFLNRRYRFGFVIMIITSIFSLGYFLTYLECNRELEINHMLDTMENNELVSAVNDWRLIGAIKNYFGYTETTTRKARENLLKAGKIKFSYCRPDHVFLLYINDILLKQLEVFIEKCTSTLFAIKDRFIFPFNYIAALMLLVLIAYITKLTFKYILNPSVWFGYITQSRHNNHHAKQLSGGTSEDRLTGENLQTLLSVLQGNAKIINTNIPTPSVSGVQEVQEQIPVTEAVTSQKPKLLATDSTNSTDEKVEISNVMQNTKDIAS